MNRNVQSLHTPAELCQTTADLLAMAITTAVRERGQCSFALAGGSTPRAVYQALAGEKHRQGIPWPHTHFFWGDERMVPPDHALSNFRMANEALLQHLEVPASNIHRMKGELAPADAAQDYRDELKYYFQKTAALADSQATSHDPRPSIFDLVLLGLGEDGHTASLFPKTHAVFESAQEATAVFVPQQNQWRVTLTLPVLNRARAVMFLVSGKSKAPVVAEIFRLEKPEIKYPAARVRPAAGELHWLLDAEAASALQQ